MLSPKFSLALALSLSLPVAHAAVTEHHADAATSAIAAPSLIAGAEELTIPFTPGSPAKAVSSGVADSLPDLPATPAIAPLAFNVRQQEQTVSAPRQPEHNSVTSALVPDEPGMLRLVEASPIGGAARRIQAQRFNTDDGVSSNDFAICYRLNSRSSVQVIPGDPAPVKLPTTALANSAGVTVGMVVRLSRQR